MDIYVTQERLTDCPRQMSRPEVVKKIWAYVKLNNLQDPTDRRYIICDDSLKPVFGDKVHMLYVYRSPASSGSLH